jgi:hypothetical protein
MTKRDNNRTVNEIKAMMAEDGDFPRPGQLCSLAARIEQNHHALDLTGSSGAR